jgi:phage terminase Nu1 subunit (DNA packaging protein)
MTMARKSELARITAEADRLAAENKARRATLWNAREVNEFWAEKVRQMGTDVTEMPMRIARRLPHLSHDDLQAIAEEFIQMVEGWEHHELN